MTQPSAKLLEKLGAADVNEDQLEAIGELQFRVNLDIELAKHGFRIDYKGVHYTNPAQSTDQT